MARRYNAKKHGRNAYKRSTRREREIVNEADRDGAYLVARTAGSKSKGGGFKTDVIEVWAMDRKIFLDQIKTKKGGRLKISRDIDHLGTFDVYTRLITWE